MEIICRLAGLASQDGSKQYTTDSIRGTISQTVYELIFEILWKLYVL